MSYDLEKLLVVRVHREDKALKQLARARDGYLRAMEAKRESERALSEYRRWRCVEESRLFNDFKQHSVGVQDLESYIVAVGALRDKQNFKARQVAEAGELLTKAEVELDKARQSYGVAYRKKVKIAEHKENWVDEQKLVAEKAAENEIEDIGRSNGMHAKSRF